MSNSALAERPPVAARVTADQLDLVKRTVASGATDAELKLYLYDCERRGIHPLDKLLHFTKRGGKYTPVTSIDFMRSQAAMTGEMAGSDDPVFQMDGSHIVSATVTVYRMTQGQRFAYAATARWAEYCPDNAPMWKRMPHTMLGKCAEALALRKAFPQQLAGLYTSDEMDQADRDTRPAVVPDPPATVIDTTTGAEVPASEQPPAPDGYVYMQKVLKRGAWYDVYVHPFRGQDSDFATKQESIGEVALQAYQMGLPVKLEHKPGKKWLDRVTVWKPETEAEFEAATQPLTADKIPF